MSTDDRGVAPEAEARESLLRRLSRETVRIQKTGFGKGPESVKSYLFDDLLLVVMRDGLTVAEKSMVAFGQEDLVRNFRQQFENEMTSRFVDMVEEVTGRKVLTYQSQIMFDPDIVVEMFVFDRAIDSGFASAESRGDEEDDAAVAAETP
jgi:uncharacterized protein YbcI